MRKKGDKIAFTLKILAVLCLFKLTLQNPKCVVDQCKRCRYINIDTCDECESGYYLRTWYGKDKKRDYNACWNLMYLLFSLLGTLLLTLSYLYCCYRAYKKGKSITKIVSDKKDKKVIKDERKISKGAKYKDERDIPSTSRPINIETEPNDAPPVTIPTMNQLPNQQPITINSPQRITQPVQRQFPVNYGGKPHFYSNGESHFESQYPTTTIIRERPTTIIREIQSRDGEEKGIRIIKKNKNKGIKRKPSARVIRYEPDSIREIKSPQIRGKKSIRGDRGEAISRVTKRRMYS